MIAAALYPHIEADANGAPCVGKTRYQVLHLAAEHYQHGWSAEELLRQHPDLRPEEVYMALAYFYDHFQSLLEQMQAQQQRSEAQAQRQTWMRAPWLQRRTAAKE